MTPEDFDQLERKLTKGEREALLRASPSGTDHYKDFDGRVRVSLFSKRLFEHAGGFMSDNPRCMLSDLGYHLRNHIRAKEASE